MQDQLRTQTCLTAIQSSLKRLSTSSALRRAAPGILSSKSRCPSLLLRRASRIPGTASASRSRTSDASPSGTAKSARSVSAESAWIAHARGIVGKERGREARYGQYLSCGIGGRFRLDGCCGGGRSRGAEAPFSRADERSVVGSVAAERWRRNWRAIWRESHWDAFREAKTGGYSGRRVRRLRRAAFGIEIRTVPGCREGVVGSVSGLNLSGSQHLDALADCL